MVGDSQLLKLVFAKAGEGKLRGFLPSWVPESTAGRSCLIKFRRTKRWTYHHTLWNLAPEPRSTNVVVQFQWVRQQAAKGGGRAGERRSASSWRQISRPRRRRAAPVGIQSSPPGPLRATTPLIISAIAARRASGPASSGVSDGRPSLPICPPRPVNAHGPSRGVAARSPSAAGAGRASVRSLWIPAPPSPVLAGTRAAGSSVRQSSADGDLSSAQRAAGRAAVEGRGGVAHAR